MSILTWDIPTTISGLNASKPDVVIDSYGEATVVWLEQSTYNIGTALQSGNTVTGTGTTFTSDMVGGILVYSEDITVNITGFVNSTELTVAESYTVSDQDFKIFYNGLVYTNRYDGTWGTPTQLSTTGNNSSNPKITVDGSNIVSIVWQEQDTTTGDTVINYTQYNGSWSSTTQLSTGTGSSDPKLVSNNNGDIAVAWIKSGNTEVIVKPISTGVWTSITTFTTANSSTPDIAIGGTVVTITWYANPTGTQDQIMASRSTTIGGSFSTPVNILGTSGTGTQNSYPKVAVDPSGNSIIVWFRSILGGSNGIITPISNINTIVLTSIFLFGSINWSTPYNVSTEYKIKNPTDLIIRCKFDFAGNVIILWTSSNYGNNFNIESYIRQNTGVAHGPYMIIEDNLTLLDAHVSINQLSNVLIPYMYFDGSNSVIEVIETDIAGYPLNQFTSPTRLSIADTNNSRPRGAISLTSSTTNAIVVWEAWDSINMVKVIHSAIGTKPVLGEPGSLSITQSTNNFDVFVQHDNNLTWGSSSDPNTIGYNIYRNDIFIVQLGGINNTSFVDNNQKKSGTGVTTKYSISSFDNRYMQSSRVENSIS